MYMYELSEPARREQKLKRKNRLDCKVQLRIPIGGEKNAWKGEKELD